MFQVPSIVQSIRTLVDGGCKLDIVTRELKPSEMTELFELKNKEGWLLFKEDIIQEKDVDSIPDEPLEKFEKKSPSQRLRAVIYKYWELKTNNKKDFNQFYLNYMEKIINMVKEKLD